jgi:pyridinium-3,5-bisthiocarboxylic acid mononucleotide nickel chelatase
MPIAILDPFSGISGDMTLGALVDVGLDPEWLRALPARLRLDGVVVRVQDVRRGEIACKKVEFEIPPQPHGRHIREIRALVAAADVPDEVREKADAAFTAIATAEGEIHGVAAETVHLHEVGAVDAILDVVGAVWGFALLGVERVYCGPLSVGDGFVTAAHGVLPVPAPATLRLLEGHPVRPGPENAGELVTPTGAALVKVLSRGRPPVQYVPRRSGFGAGSKDPRGRANALRIILADAGPVAEDGVGGEVEEVVILAADIDDMSPEYVALAADALRGAGALDVVLLPTLMKKGRPGARLEVLARPGGVEALEEAIFAHTATLGVRRAIAERRVLRREASSVEVLGHAVRVKVAHGPGGSRHAKPESDDVRRVAEATGRPARDIFLIATNAAEHL